MENQDLNNYNQTNQTNQTNNNNINNNQTEKPKKRKKTIIWIIFSLISLVVITFFYLQYKRSSYSDDLQFDNKVEEIVKIDSTELKKELENKSADSLAKLISKDTNYVTVSDSANMIGMDPNASESRFKQYRGRRINIAITGVDSRLGDRYKHADANHVLSILLDSGKIEIISVPRDTPVDAGFEDSTGQNKLTVSRATLGRNGYLRELANIAKVDKIHYYVEFGFSQAMGIIDWLGYKDKASTLQVLRSRTGLGGDDYQRCYNQAQFIRQNIIRNFDKLSGVTSSILVPSLLMIVETNLTSANAFSIIDALEKNGFGDLADITVQVRPQMFTKFKVYDFTNDETVSNLKQKIESFNKYRANKFGDTTKSINVQNKVVGRLSNLIKNNTADTLKNPTKVIQNLSVVFEQKAWLQVIDSTKRVDFRNKITELLIVSHTKKKNLEEAQKIKNYLELEKKLYENKAR